MSGKTVIRAVRPARLTPLVGRQAELTRLRARWDAAKQGVGQVVVVQGEPGIGKSRLVRAFRQGLVSEAHTVHELRCFSEYSQSPFHPVLVLLETALGFALGDDADVRAAKLARHVATAYPELAADAVPLLLALHSLPSRIHRPASELPPSRRKERTIETLCEVLQAGAERAPVLLVMEDLHWADPSTLQLLSALVERRSDVPMLLLITTEPGLTTPFEAPVELLASLARHEIEQVIASIGEDLPAVTIRRIVERADGVPFFAEELAKAAAHDEGAGKPGTLHEILAARMDRVGEAKHTAQLAASIGRQFDIDLLRQVSPNGRDVLEMRLGQLADAGLITCVSESIGQFRHALLQEAAYQSQSRPDQQAAHRRIGEALRSGFADRAAAAPELIAHHLSLAGELRQSIEYWTAAGQRAIRCSANLEAIAHFNSGRQLLMSLPGGLERDQAEFAILAGLTVALHATQGDGSKEATEISTRLSALLEEAGGGNPDLFQAE